MTPDAVAGLARAVYPSGSSSATRTAHGSSACRGDARVAGVPNDEGSVRRIRAHVLTACFKTWSAGRAVGPRFGGARLLLVHGGYLDFLAIAEGQGPASRWRDLLGVGHTVRHIRLPNRWGTTFGRVRL